MRAYTISLVAVFLALGIGIVLGTVIQDKGILEKNWKSLVQRIESQVDELRTEQRELSGQVNRLRQFEAQVLPLVISDGLTGKTITVVSSPSFPNNLEGRMIKILEQAGAIVRRVDLREEALALPKERAAEVTALFAASTALKKKPEIELVEGIARGLVSDTAVPNLESLAAAAFLGVRGTGNPSMVILAVEPKKDSQAVDLLRPFLAEIKRLGVPVIAVEPEKSLPSLVPAFRAAGASTVDNVDSVAGQIALVYLAGGKSGSFGVKQMGLPLLPPPP